jgi:iron(II)-dependent oxidoreductase
MTASPPAVAAVTDKAVLAAELDRVRRRTLALVDPLSEADQTRQHSPIMSPLVWDLAHVGNYEEQWLQRALGGPPAEHPEYDDLYDAFQHPRADRPSLPLLGPDEARRYIAGVRERVLEVLAGVELDGAPDPLLAGAFEYGMVIQHEHQHDETMLATRQLMGERASPPAGTTPAPVAVATVPDEVEVSGGPFVVGTDHPWAYDNERPVHEVALPAFAIDAAPVTNDRYCAFIEAGGYDDARWWDPAGWAWRQEVSAAAPLYWRRTGSGWEVLRYGTWRSLRPREPVQHVCWYEADAFARWAGQRLPTEFEWERAAAGARAPDANLGQRHDGPSEVGAHPGGTSDLGVHHTLGDVWEWTASDFLPYPGFRAFPYREYSEVFWGSAYKVLRGGSWATDPVAARTAFRNWDLPIRRQIFAGFRCARDL